MALPLSIQNAGVGGDVMKFGRNLGINKEYDRELGMSI